MCLSVFDFVLNSLFVFRFYFCRSPSSSREVRTALQNGLTKRRWIQFRLLLSTEANGVDLYRRAVAASHRRYWNTWCLWESSTRNPAVTSRFTLAIWALRWSFAKSADTWRSLPVYRAISPNKEPAVKGSNCASKDVQLRSASTSPPSCWEAGTAVIQACHLVDDFIAPKRTNRHHR